MEEGVTGLKGRSEGGEEELLDRGFDEIREDDGADISLEVQVVRFEHIPRQRRQ